MKKLLKNKNQLLFSLKDIRQIKQSGMHLKDVQKQLDLYKHGPTFLNLIRPCTVRDGILDVTSAQRKELISFYEKNSPHYRLMKFVPASGAASRMFAEWFYARNQGGFRSAGFRQSFFNNIKKYPFYFLIQQNKRAVQFIRQKNINGILDYILTEKGLKYGWLPKALIPFHVYDGNKAYTALEEHLYEAAHYVRGSGNVCNVHFTISQEHQKEMIKKINAVKGACEKKLSVKYKISLSIQSASTNMLAADQNDQPLRDETGRMIFRPGGHGSLLGNLNRLNADFIFIRNIDNVPPQTLGAKIVPYRKMIGGLAMRFQEEIFDSIRRLEASRVHGADIDKIQLFCASKLNIHFSRNFMNQSLKEKIKILYDVLNRPFRVCGVVRNNREPGGGPFWVEENDGHMTLQIVENAHVDKGKKDQRVIWSKARYFNPVDMVCCIKNHQGRKFDLFNYVNNNSYTISIKNEKGMRVKALEMPGLWNGSMAYWNTVFVKLPLFVFNPVKEVHDFLRPGHFIS